jgi:hypothetical protein
MAYLRYYQMRGDPGFFGALGKLAGKVARGIPGLGTALTVADLAHSGAKALFPGATAKFDAAAIGGLRGAIGGMGGGPLGMAMGMNTGIAGGRIAATTGGRRGFSVPAIPGAGRSRARAGGGGGAGAGGGRRYRRMNPTNFRALSRAMRRVTRFSKMAKSVMTFTAHHRMKVKSRRRTH